MQLVVRDARSMCVPAGVGSVGAAYNVIFCIRFDLAGVVEQYVPTDDDGGMVPDFSDPATVGGLRLLVSEAWADPIIYTRWGPAHDGKGWTAWTNVGACLGFAGTTEAEALVVALERAP